MDDSKFDSHADAMSVATDHKETSEKYGTTADQEDMRRMGKQQKLRVSWSVEIRDMADVFLA